MARVRTFTVAAVALFRRANVATLTVKGGGPQKMMRRLHKIRVDSDNKR
jgi:hypothetical protein